MSKKTASTKTRTRQLPEYRSFKLSRKKLKQHARVPGPHVFIKQTLKVIFSNKKVFLGIALINALISFVFVQGLGSAFDIRQLKSDVEDTLGGGNQLGTATAVFGYLLGSAGTAPAESSSAYQTILVIVTSLAAVWGIRQIQAGSTPSLKDTFYKGMYPLIPFLLVLFVIALQILPLLLGNLIYGTVTQNGLATNPLEYFLTVLVFLLLAILSLYMLTSSVFALYISTLPDMTPLKALRSARELVLHRRLKVGVRIVALPIAFLLAAALIFIPLIIVAPYIAQILFLLVTSFGLVACHVYMYLLYRALI